MRFRRLEEEDFLERSISMHLLSRFSRWQLGTSRGLDTFVRKHLRDEGRFGDYRFVFHRGKPKTWLHAGIFCDGEYTIILARKVFGPFRDDIACISFHSPTIRNLVAEPGVIEVVQIQGVERKEQELKTLRWDRMLLEMLTILARESGFAEVRVQASRQNPWLQCVRDPDLYTKRKKVFHLRYDVLPKRMGFTPGEQYHTLMLKP